MERCRDEKSRVGKLNRGRLLWSRSNSGGQGARGKGKGEEEGESRKGILVSVFVHKKSLLFRVQTLIPHPPPLQHAHAQKQNFEQSE